MKKINTAIIQAGGRGSRLLEITHDDIPKPLAIINGKVMLEWQISNLKKYGVSNIIIIIGHLGNKIKEHFKDGKEFGVNIEYIQENEPLGSAGALYFFKEKNIGENFLLIFGDVMFDIDFNRMENFHIANNAMATLLVHPNTHPYDSDLVILDDRNLVTKFILKTDERKEYYNNCVNSGIYMFSKDILEYIYDLKKIDLERELLNNILDNKRVYGYHTPEYVKDAGTIDRFYEVQKECKQGVWKYKNLENKQKCIFLDRDGTINKYNGLIDNEDKMELETNAAEAIRLINKSNYLVIIVTNQPVVARGMCSIEEVKNIHKKLQTLLGEKGAYVDDIVFCPHHPDRGFKGENLLYKISCECRKPSIGMIEQMVNKYNININESYMIGDTTTDIMTGINAKMKTILVHTGETGKDKKFNVIPDIEAEDLLEAVKMILRGNESD